MTSTTDPLGHTTQFGYDLKGNLISITDPLGNQSTFSYDSSGKVLTATDSAGNTTQLNYSAGDLVSIVDPLGRMASQFVDGVGRINSVVAPSGQITKYEYNPLNQVTKITDALGGVSALSYDGNGNLTSLTDARNTSTPTIYTYDNMDRLFTRKDPLGNTECYGTFAGSTCQSNGYDGLGNLLQYTDRRGKVTTYNYDPLNRLSFAGYGTQIGPSYESTVSFTYDAGDRPTQIVDSLSGTITPVFDGLDRLTSETSPQGSITYTFDLAGRRQSMTVAGQPTVNYTFDSVDRLTQIAQGGSTVQFSYDAGSRRATLTLPNGIVTSYDKASQLAGLSYSLGASSTGDLVYAYDQNGRRVSVAGSFARTGIPSPINSTAYNANNQLTIWGTANLFYDANGNMTSDGTHSYTWDARNQLKQIDSGSTASFGYDPFGRRVSKTILGTSRGFLYDGENPVQELSGTTPTANLLTGSLDEYFTRTDSSGPRYFLTDPLASTLSLADPSGMLKSSYTFEPFGSTTLTGEASTSSFAYTGRELDAAGLYFYRARYLNTSFQRFLSEDPLGASWGANLYSYVDQNPVNFVDPTGLKLVAVGDTGSVSLAVDYLAGDKMMRHMIQDLIDSPITYYINTNSRQDNGFNGFRTVYWDPHMGITCEGEGGGQGAQLSPAAALGHELGHVARRGPQAWDQGTQVPRNREWDYDNLAEQIVIQNYEWSMALSLREGMRRDHRGQPVRVGTPLTKPTCGKCQRPEQYSR